MTQEVVTHFIFEGFSSVSLFIFVNLLLFLNLTAFDAFGTKCQSHNTTAQLNPSETITYEKCSSIMFMMTFGFEQVENIVGKTENVVSKAFLTRLDKRLVCIIKG